MMSSSDFLTQADARYRDTNRRTMQWVLSRSENSPWINTKFHPIEQRDYAAGDDLRGPDYLYGWIQGRALEALIQHGTGCADDDPTLSAALLDRSRLLYQALDELYSRHNMACFCYDRNLTPILTSPSSGGQVQRREAGIRTYSDLFVVKGLIAASVHHAPDNLQRHVAELDQIITAIDSDRFLMNESGHIDEAALQRQIPDFGPRMIALGAASLLHSLDLHRLDTFSTRFVEQVLEQHAHGHSGLISNSPGGQTLNPGHAIELIGFHFETWGNALPDTLTARLAQLLDDTFSAAFDGQGLRLSIDLDTRQYSSELSPWWSLPETIRAAALAFELTQEPRFLKIWQAADTAFFKQFWLDTPPIAVQMMRNGCAVDAVPATPDLDPGYHTGLSLLAASHVCRRMIPPSTTD